jgi:hypothetical protein
MAHRISAGCASSDHDRAEHSPVRFASVEQGSDAVVLEVAEPKANPFDPLDQVVDRFGGSVGDTSEVEVAELFRWISDTWSGTTLN